MLCRWLLLVPLITAAFSYDPSLLGVNNKLGLRGDGPMVHILPVHAGPISTNPKGLPIDEQNTEDVTSGQDQKGPAASEDGHRIPHTEHHKAAPHGEAHKKEAAHAKHHEGESHHGSGEHGHHEGEAHHGEEEHGASEGEAHHEEPEQESISLAYLLMGGVGALMVVFHFASSPSLDVKLSAWRVLNMTVSIFVAVLMYGTLKGLIERVFEPSPRSMVAIVLVLFVVLFVGSHAILFTRKGTDEAQLQAAGTILAHICGFAAMYGFADSAEIEWLEELGTIGFVSLIVVAAIIISSLSFIMDKVMNRIAKGSPGRPGAGLDEAELKWIETCEETDDDVFCLAISFLIVLLFRYLIRGKPQPYEPGNVGNVTQTHANWLLFCAGAFAALVCVGAIMLKRMERRLTHGSAAARVATNAQHLNSMIMAWSFLFWAEWQLYVSGYEKTIIGGCLVVAIFLTMFGFACVFLLNFIEVHCRESKTMRRALSSLELAIGVLIGFSWERSFDVGFEEVALKYHGSLWGNVVVVLMSVALLAIVGPAWRIHILPKVIELEEKATNQRERVKGPA